MEELVFKDRENPEGKSGKQEAHGFTPTDL